MNFLILLTRVHHTLPHKCLLEFIQTLLSCPVIKDEWVLFYLGQLLNLTESKSHTASELGSDCEQGSQDKQVLRTCLSKATVNRLHGLCSQRFSSSVEGIEVVTVSSSGEQCYVNFDESSERMEVDEEIPTGSLNKCITNYKVIFPF